MHLMNKKEISECIGLYLGDGLRSMKGSSGYRISFTNNDLGLIRKMKRFFNWLGIPNSRIHAQIDIPIETTDINKEKIEVLGKIKMNSNKALFRIEKRRKSSVQIRAFSKLTREKLNNIIDKESSQLNIRKASNILRGLFAAEGRVKLQKESLNALCIATSEAKNYELLDRILKMLNFKFYYSKAEFYIHSFYQFKRFKELKIHVLHYEKRKKFERAYKVLRRNFYLAEISQGSTAE